MKDKSLTAENAADRVEIEKIKAENKELCDRSAELERQLAEARRELADARANRNEGGEDNDLGRRYEMSLDDLRELKARNDDLQEQLARTRQAGGADAGQIRPGVLNWEAEKQRILAALEADFERRKRRRSQ